MIKDKRLEELSDCVRRGIPIDFRDAIEVIAYQEELRKQRNFTLTGKMARFFGKFKTLVHFPTRKFKPEEELESVQESYYELIMAVENKYPGESRHQTALRLIKEGQYSQPANSVDSEGYGTMSAEEIREVQECTGTSNI